MVPLPLLVKINFKKVPLLHPGYPKVFSDYDLTFFFFHKQSVDGIIIVSFVKPNRRVES